MGGELIWNNFADSKQSQSFFQKYKHTIEKIKMHGEFETERPSVVHMFQGQRCFVFLLFKTKKKKWWRS